MNKNKTLKIVSVICSIIGLILALIGLIVGLLSLKATDFGKIGTIFILPSITAFIIIFLDYLISTNKIKNGLKYSYISSIIKIIIIACCIPEAVDDYMYELKYGESNFDFDLILIISLTLVAIPSILNIITLTKNKSKI